MMWIYHSCPAAYYEVSRKHLAALTRSRLIGDHPSGLAKEQATETIDPSPKAKGLQAYPRQRNLELVGTVRLSHISLSQPLHVSFYF